MKGGGGGGSESGVSLQLQGGSHRDTHRDKENDRVASEKQNEMSGLQKK